MELDFNILIYHDHASIVLFYPPTHNCLLYCKRKTNFDSWAQKGGHIYFKRQKYHWAEAPYKPIGLEKKFHLLDDGLISCSGPH